jgi:hypothetical protein
MADDIEAARAIVAGLESLAVVAADQSRQRRPRRAKSQAPLQPVETDTTVLVILRHEHNEVSRQLANPADANRAAIMLLARYGRFEVHDTVVCISPGD